MEPTIQGSGTQTTAQAAITQPPTTHAAATPQTILANSRATAQKTANISNAANQAYQADGPGTTQNS